MEVNIVVASVVVVVSDRVVVAASVVDDGAILRMVERFVEVNIVVRRGFRQSCGCCISC